MTMLYRGGLTFYDFVTNTFAIFMFILWFWLLITVSGDLFSVVTTYPASQGVCGDPAHRAALYRHIRLPAHQGGGMAERNQARARRRERTGHVIGFQRRPTRLEKLDRLKTAGSISENEYTQLESRLFK